MGAESGQLCGKGCGKWEPSLCIPGFRLYEYITRKNTQRGHQPLCDLETLIREEGEFRYQALGWKLGRARVQGGGWAAKPRESARAPEQAAAVAFYITMARRLLGTTRNRASTLILCWVVVGTEVGRK